MCRKRASVAIGYCCRTQGRGNGGLDHGGSRNDGYLKAKLAGLLFDRKWGVSEKEEPPDDGISLIEKGKVVHVGRSGFWGKPGVWVWTSYFDDA